MSRRKKRAEMETGSDSFLDIIANIVGILIILIVIAGIRVSQLPQEPTEPPALVEATPIPEPEPVEVEPPALPEVVLGAASLDPSEELLPPEPIEMIAEADPEPEPGPPKPPEPSPQLLAEITLLEQELRKFEADANDAVATLAETVQAERKTGDELAATKEHAKAELQRLTVLEAQLNEQKQKIEDDREHMALLADEIEAQRKPQKNVKQLTHRLTPVSQVVDGEEFHFRLADNRVSVVPLKQLIEELKSGIQRRKSWLARSRSHHGSVGPISGFRMRYLVERKPLSVVEELQYGSGTFRVVVSAWQLMATSAVKAETVEEALQSDSNFVNALKRARTNTALTFWVYPDSFGLFRKLQEVAHHNGFIVSARPLPEGVPIAGSPHGSRSAGQ